jgi:hypothetical protein
MTRWRRWLAFLGVVIGLVALAFVPTETTQGIDFAVTSRRLPLYAKALDFVQRDWSYSRLAAGIAPEDASPESRALAIFEWTRRNIRDTPNGFPVVDDHVSHIVIRGYGEAEQKADVFTTLATYAGLPGYWTRVGNEPPTLVLSYVWIAGRWRVFDVENGVVFRTSRGGLASVHDLIVDPSVLASVAEDRLYHSRPYRRYFDDFRAPIPPDLLRAEQQMLWPRAFHRVKRLVGLGQRQWQVGLH